MRQVDKDHVQRWIAEHDACVMPESESERVADAINALPWAGSVPDWGAIGAVRVHLDDPALGSTLERSRVGYFEHVFVIYAKDEPGLVARLRDISEDIDLLSWTSPGIRFFCGATRVDDEWRAEPGALGAYDGADHLTLRT
jgi:hypothetical protein